jgi:hypothetical protein
VSGRLQLQQRAGEQCCMRCAPAVSAWLLCMQHPAKPRKPAECSPVPLVVHAMCMLPRACLLRSQSAAFLCLLDDEVSGNVRVWQNTCLSQCDACCFCTAAAAAAVIRTFTSGCGRTGPCLRSW